MLKIKDNVDLKELEKYGFKIKKGIPRYFTCKGLFGEEEWFVRGLSGKDIGYSVKGNGFGWALWNLDILYDLIKADLVEKVGSDNE